MRFGFTFGSATAIVLALAACPVMARDQDKPVTDKSVDAVDVATTPMSDLNIRKEEIPTILLIAQTSPYDVANLGRCPQIAAAVGELDAVLGTDIDLPQPGEKLSPGRVAQSVVGSFFPFRGVIREVSGANDQRRRMEAAIQAGIARRAFLKGYGQAKNCRYPARSVTPEAYSAYVASLQPAAAPKAK
jgi:hypothetical protein